MGEEWEEVGNFGLPGESESTKRGEVHRVRVSFPITQSVRGIRKWRDATFLPSFLPNLRGPRRRHARLQALIYS